MARERFTQIEKRVAPENLHLFTSEFSGVVKGAIGCLQSPQLLKAPVFSGPFVNGMSQIYEIKDSDLITRQMNTLTAVGITWMAEVARDFSPTEFGIVLRISRDASARSVLQREFVQSTGNIRRALHELRGTMELVDDAVALEVLLSKVDTIPSTSTLRIKYPGVKLEAERLIGKAFPPFVESPELAEYINTICPRNKPSSDDWEIVLKTNTDTQLRPGESVSLKPEKRRSFNIGDLDAHIDTLGRVSYGVNNLSTLMGQIKSGFNRDGMDNDRASGILGFYLAQLAGLSGAEYRKIAVQQLYRLLEIRYPHLTQNQFANIIGRAQQQKKE